MANRHRISQLVDSGLLATMVVAALKGDGHAKQHVLASQPPDDQEVIADKLELYGIDPFNLDYHGMPVIS